MADVESAALAARRPTEHGSCALRLADHRPLQSRSWRRAVALVAPPWRQVDPNPS